MCYQHTPAGAEDRLLQRAVRCCTAAREVHSLVHKEPARRNALAQRPKRSQRPGPRHAAENHPQTSPHWISLEFSAVSAKCTQRQRRTRSLPNTVYSATMPSASRLPKSSPEHVPGPSNRHSSAKCHPCDRALMNNNVAVRAASPFQGMQSDCVAVRDDPAAPWRDGSAHNARQSGATNTNHLWVQFSKTCPAALEPRSRLHRPERQYRRQWAATHTRQAKHTRKRKWTASQMASPTVRRATPRH